MNGLEYSNLPGAIQTILRTRPTLRAIIVLRQSDPAIKYEVFQRLNTGGVPLNPQEIRNNLFSGLLNTKINEIGESTKFHGALGITKKNESIIYKEMRDSELVLRFMTFSDTWETFSGGVRRQMDTFMDTNQNIKARRVNELSQRFDRALDNVLCVFGDDAFKRWQPDKKSWRNQRLASLFDAQMLGLQEFAMTDLQQHKIKIMNKFKLMFNNEKFLQSIDAATNTPSYLKFRVSHLRAAVQKAI